MTRYQTPPQPPSNDSVTPDPDPSPPRLDPSDLESRMARLVGLEEDPQSSHEDSATLKQPTITEPQDVQTLAPLSSNPFAKAGLVGAGTLAVVVVAGVFLSQMMSGNNNKSKNNVVTPKATAQPTIDPRFQQQAEVEALKTKLALAEQANDVKAAQQELRTQKPKVVVKPTPTVRPAVVPQRIPTPTVRTVYVPRVVTAPPQLPVRTIPTPVPVVKPVLAPTPTVQPTVATTPPPPPDPLQTWARLAKLGSYGQVSNATTAPINVSSPTLPRGGTIGLERPAASPYTKTSPAIPVASQVTQTQRTSKSVKVGTRVKGVLDTGIFGESSPIRSSGPPIGARNTNNDNQNSSSNELFKVRLTEPLKAEDGSIAVPANATIFTKIHSISDKGLVQLDVVKFSWLENGNLTERSVSSDAVSIRGPKSQPLVATQYQSGGGSHIGSDAQLFALGALGKVGEVLNRPDSRVVALNSSTQQTDAQGKVIPNSTPIVTTNSAVLTEPKRDVLPALLEGGEKLVSPELTRRIQQKSSRNLQERSNIWYLAAGKSVELFFNQDSTF